MARITRLVPPRASGLLGECRKLIRDALPPVLKHFIDRVDDAFFELANKADSSQRQQLYFDAMRELRLKRPLLEREFFNSLDESFQACVNVPSRGVGSGPLPGPTELSLVAADDVEENLAVTNLVESLQSRARQELFALDQRVAHLLSDPGLANNTNPFGPEVIGKALRAMADGLTAGVEVKITLLKLFDRHGAASTIDLYHSLNELLVKEDILPRLTPSYGRNAGARTRVIIETDEGTAEAAGDDVFETLQRLMGGIPALTSGAAGNGRGPAAAGGFGAFQQGPGHAGTAHPSGSSSGFPSGGTAGLGNFIGGSGLVPGSTGGAVQGSSISTSALISNLTQLQHGNQVSREFASYGSFDPGMVATGSVNVIRAIRESGLASGLNDTDTLTLDIVALLFDYILKDDSIADAIKALIGRLQIPYLKIALLDKDLFSKKSHPARRLLDAMAEAAIGLGETTMSHDSLYEKINVIVGRVIEEFDSDLGLFGQLLADFQAFLTEDLAATQKRREISTKSLKTREKVVLAKMAVDEAVKQRLDAVETRDFIRQFVQDYWRQMLIVTHVEAGPESDAWQSQLQVIDELAWSVQQKTNADEKKELTARLPKLLKQIRAGMHELEMDPKICSQFLTMLASVHVVSVKQVEEATLAERKLLRKEAEQGAALASEQSEEEFVKQALNRLFARKSIDEEALDIDLSAFEGPPDSAALASSQASSDEVFVDQLMELDLGDWLDLVTVDNTTVRARFTYISPVTGRYLFTDRQGNKIFDLNFDELLAFYRRGGATRVSTQPDPLFDRAIGELMNRLEAQAVA